MDLFWLHVEFTCVRHTWKNAISPRDEKLPTLMSSIASGLVTVDFEDEYLTVVRYEVGLYTDILADFAEQRCEKVLDAIMSLCNKTHLFTQQGVADMNSKRSPSSSAKGHFPVPLSLCIKTRLSAQPLIWKWFFILMQIKLIFTRKAEHLASFWKWGFLELCSGLLA